jgi:DNA-binding NarL/FixJ family response regulator
MTVSGLVFDQESVSGAMIASKLGRHDGIGLVQRVSNESEALTWCARQNFGVIVLGAPTARASELLGLVRRVLTVRPRANILAAIDDATAVRELFDAGVRGFLRRSDVTGSASPPIDSPATTERHIEGGIERARPPASALTDREDDLLQRFARGMSNAAIGAELNVSEDTVKTHARRLHRKLHCTDRAHAVARAFRAGLLR